MKEHDQCKISDEKNLLNDSPAHQCRAHGRKYAVILQRRCGPPVVGEDLRIVVAQRIDEVNRVIAQAELIAANQQREGHSHHQQQEFITGEISY